MDREPVDLRVKRAQSDINEALGVKPQPPDIGYGRREDGTSKGRGFYGMLPRTDGPDQSSELSIGVEMDGKQRTIPSMVPGLNAEQLRYLLSVQKPMRPDITQKAVDFAVQRQQQGKGPFAEPNEEGAYRVPRYAQGGSVKARRRSPSDYVTDAIASGLGVFPAYRGDERAAYQRAKDFTGLLDWTPAGIPEALYEAGGMLGAGARDRSALGTAGGLGMAAIAGLPLPGKKAAKEAMQKGIRAYHGSPHAFDKFDLSKIGTGEGAQSYGHGLYFAENEGVARAYRDNVKDMGFVRDVNSELSALAKIMEADSIAGQYRKFRTDAGRNAAAKYDAMMDARSQRLSDPGHMYEVNINADPAQFLDWDAPLSAQPHIAEALVDSFKVPSMERRHMEQWRAPKWSDHAPDTNYLDAVKASTKYQALAGDLGAWHKASEALKERGIPGIKYLDEGSRNLTPANIAKYEKKVADARLRFANDPENSYRIADAEQELESMKRQNGDMTRNFVVFRPELVDILKRYAVPVAGAGTAASLAVKAKQPQEEDY